MGNSVHLFRREDGFFMKYFLLVGIWLVLLSNVLWAKTYVIGYEIYGDSNNGDVIAIKEDIFRQYDALVDRVDDLYIHQLLKEYSEQFVIDDAVITYDHMVLRVVVGDGMGIYIHGELVQENCMIKPRTESIFQKIFQ